MSSLDNRLDLSLDDLIKRASQVKRPTKAAPAKPAASGPRSTGLVPKQVRSRAPLTTVGGIAGKRQAIRAGRKAPTAAGAGAGGQRPVPRVLLVKVADLKRRGAAPMQGARALAKRIVNRAVMAPKQTTAAAPRQRVAAVQRPQAAATAARPRQQQQAARQPRQQIAYVQQPVVVQHQPRQVPVSLTKRMRQQRQQQQVVMQPAGRRGQAPRQVVAAPQGGQRRVQQQPAPHQAVRILPSPRAQQQRQMLGRVQQGGVMKSRGQVHQPPPRRAPVFAGNANVGGRSGNNQRGRQQQQQQQQQVAPQRQQRGGGRGRNQQAAAGSQRQRAPILMQQAGRGGRGAGGRGQGRRGRR